MKIMLLFFSLFFYFFSGEMWFAHAEQERFLFGIITSIDCAKEVIVVDGKGGDGAFGKVELSVSDAEYVNAESCKDLILNSSVMVKYVDINGKGMARSVTVRTARSPKATDSKLSLPPRRGGSTTHLSMGFVDNIQCGQNQLILNDLSEKNKKVLFTLTDTSEIMYKNKKITCQDMPSRDAIASVLYKEDGDRKVAVKVLVATPAKEEVKKNVK